ncbi:hypothetical protein [Streptomyces sp. NPDC002845]
MTAEHPSSTTSLGIESRAEEAYQSKGMLIAHVQSGRSANIAGVVGKAIDAGYRLVIVLSGTTNLPVGSSAVAHCHRGWERSTSSA